MMEEDSNQEQGLAQLTQHQQNTVANFQEIVQIHDDSLCIQILQHNNWNLERALNSFVQGGSALSHGQEHAQNSATTSRSYNESSQASSSNPPGRQTLTPHAATQEVGNVGGGGSLLDLVFVPLRWLFQARPTSLNPNRDAQVFADEFNTEYGRNHPEFHLGSYQSAVALAFSQSKFLLVYLHSPLHEDTDRFCRQALSSESFTRLANEQLVIWAGKIWDAEAYGLSAQLGATAFPFLALLVPQSARVVQIAERVQGYVEEGVLVERLQSAIGVFAAIVARQRQEQLRREETTRLREQQNREYEESMAQERRERERQEREDRERLEAAERQRREEEEALARENARKQEREALINRLRSMFATSDNDQLQSKPGGDVAVIRFQLPRGKKISRNFLKTDKIRKLYDYLTLQFYDEGDVTKNFSVFIPHPRTEINDMEQTIEGAGLFPRGMLYVQDLDT